MCRFLVCFLFLVCSCFADVIPNLKFEVDRTAALFAQVYFEQDICKELYDEIRVSFGANLDSTKDEKILFVDKLISGKVDHKFMTPTFMKLLTNARSKYDPVFDNNFDILSDRAFELNDYSRSVLSSDHIDFRSVFSFYNSQSDRDTEFRVFLFPTNKAFGSFSRAFGHNIFLKFNYGFKASDICAVLEQVCYTLFEMRDKDIRDSTESYFMKHRSKVAKAAYFLLSETLAYAIGGIWAHSKLPGLSDSILKKHKDSRIESLAHAILPIIKDYMKARRAMDNAFYDKFIRQVEFQYPSANLSFDFMLTRISLVVENGLDIPRCKDILNSEFDIKEFRSKPSDFTTVFIGTNLGDRSLIDIQDRIPNKQSDFLLVTYDKNYKLFIVIKTNKEDKIRKAIKDLGKQREIKKDYLKEL